MSSAIFEPDFNNRIKESRNDAFQDCSILNFAKWCSHRLLFASEHETTLRRSSPGRFGVLPLTVNSIDGKLCQATSGLVLTARPPEPTQQWSRKLEARLV